MYFLVYSILVSAYLRISSVFKLCNVYTTSIYFYYVSIIEFWESQDDVLEEQLELLDCKLKLYDKCDDDYSFFLFINF